MWMCGDFHSHPSVKSTMIDERCLAFKRSNEKVLDFPRGLAPLLRVVTSGEEVR